MQIEGGLWLADYFASGLVNGLSGVVYYQYEPVPLSQNHGCPSDWGNLTMFVADRKAHIRATGAQYHAAQMLTQEWVAPGNDVHDLFPATSGGNLTAYALKRPDGTWSVMLVNKDPQPRNVALRFAGVQGADASFAGNVTEVTYGSAQYAWQAQGRSSHPSPNDPPLRSTMPAPATYVVPAQSITVFRGTIAPAEPVDR
jgi:hypothetical protein